MKKNVIKTAFAAVCVIAAGLGGLKAYNVTNLSKAEMLLAQNVDALSAGDDLDESEFGFFGIAPGNPGPIQYPYTVEFLKKVNDCYYYELKPMYDEKGKYMGDYKHIVGRYDTEIVTDKKTFNNSQELMDFYATHPQLATAKSCDRSKVRAPYYPW